MGKSVEYLILKILDSCSPTNRERDHVSEENGAGYLAEKLEAVPL